MLSVATVRSAGGAADYFAKDNYYLGDSEAGGEYSTWGGKGSEALGLEGEVDKTRFERLLDGKLPDGTVINDNEKRVAGMDLTFSMPKSASLLALVGGDKRILEAHRDAVAKTMAYAEKHFAEARDYSRNRRGEPVATGNLVYAMFEHDTSRALDPQSHIHVVIAALTQKGDQFKALFNRQLWQNNSILGAAYHAQFRESLHKLGYETQITGKHGQFEIKGVDQKVIDQFSKRTAQIEEKIETEGITSHEGKKKATLTTRDPKLNVEDKEKLGEQWKAEAREAGFRPEPLIEAARDRASQGLNERPISKPSLAADIMVQAREVIGSLGDYVRPAESLTTNGMGRIALTPSQLRTEMAVASAVRILGAREAAFSRHEVMRTAVNLALPGVTAQRIEARINRLTNDGHLIAGRSERLDHHSDLLTTPEHLRTERAILRGVQEGKGKVPAIAAPDGLADRLQAVAGEHPLSGEQLAAATLVLASEDRTVAVQGLAGAGKSSMLSSVASVADAQGKRVLGLAVANKMVNALRDDVIIRNPDGTATGKGEANQTKIEARSLSAFINEHIKGALAGEGPQYEASRAALKDTVIVLDEASLVGNTPMKNLLTIANRLGVEKLALIGDQKQLMPVDDGKSFKLLQDGPAQTATLETSYRQRTDHMKQVAGLSRQGRIGAAVKALGDKVIESEDRTRALSEHWLGLSEDERAETAIYTAGREARARINEEVQKGLRAEGTLKGEGRVITTLLPANTTPEELRYAQTYKAGMVAEVHRRDAPGGLPRGRYEVLGHDKKGRVLLKPERGRQIAFDPSTINPEDKREALTLSEKHKDKVHEGDKVRWNAKDDARGLRKSEEAQVLKADKDAVMVLGKDGQEVMLKNGDPMLERMGLAYALNMHQAQGETTPKAIGELSAENRNLTNERLAHVMITRVRDDMRIFTDDKDRLIRQLESNAGDKASALEAIGRAPQGERDPGKEQAKTERARIPDGLKPKESMLSDPKVRESLIYTPEREPEKQPEVKVPERSRDFSR